jgi:(S)-2-hydroxyglutarate dehydrogenase
MAGGSTWDVIIVGGGIVGAATMYKLQARFPAFRILLIEKEKQLADHQTGHNSGVIHSGIYYKPGSWKAKNCVQGRRELVAFCKEHNVAHDVCGKIIVATDKEELPRLEKIHNTGIQNGIEDIELIGPEHIKEIEPHCAGIGGIRVGCTGIVDFRGATRAMTEIARGRQQGSAVCLGEEVTGSALEGERGDYYELTEVAKHKVKHLIYPVPDPRFPFLGVHFTRMTDGSIECGPNAVFTFKREGYSKTDFSLRDTADALTYGGTWKLFFKNMSYGIDEYRRAFSKRLFLKTLRRLIPSLTMDDIEPGRSGVRAMLLGTDGNMVDDFRIETRGRHIHVLNAPSPAATACLAIGDRIVDMCVTKLGMQ